MKSQFVALAIVLAGLPALAWGQDCGCTSRVSMGRRPASYGAWADYQPSGSHEGCGCASACCDPCCRPLLCIIPNTVQKIGCALDCLLPCGPRSCTSRVSCGSGVSCTSGCPSCTGGVPASDPFQDDVPAPLPPKPAPQETRHQKSVMAPRSVAVAPSAASKSVLTRNTQRSVIDGGLRVSDEVSQANHLAPVVKKPASTVKRTSAQSSTSARSASIPHNPLR